MYKIAFASGKGGAGKTSIAAAFYATIADRALLIDCDVDASNCFILFENKVEESTPFFSGRLYTVDSARCTSCGVCRNICRFDAVEMNVIRGSAHIDPFRCEGCGACIDVCHTGALQERENYCGDLYRAVSSYESPLYYARLHPGEDNSGKLINEIKKRAYAESSYPYAVIDAPPGTGCPVISSLSGIDALIIVIEATESGIADANKLMELVEGKKYKIMAVLNKSGVAPLVEKNIEETLAARGIPLTGKIPFDRDFYRLLGEKKLITETENEQLYDAIEHVITKIREYVDDNWNTNK